MHAVAFDCGQPVTSKKLCGGNREILKKVRNAIGIGVLSNETEEILWLVSQRSELIDQPKTQFFV
ncbi:MAG: hypothetical protein JHC61_09305 [Burkholderiaceae bacterium]|jgi:hypothetical protein|nr:hypothetical protein [Burkholderiaceae bacterium]